MSGAILLLLFQIASYAPPVAVDHVTTLEVMSRGVPEREAVVYRSGRHMRQVSPGLSGSDETYTDLTTRLEIDTHRDRQNVLQRISFHRGYFPSTRLPPTGRRGRGIGEACTISRFTQDRRTTGGEICETADGILLWHAFWYPPGNRTVLYERATAIERRPVRPDEVLPPRDLLAIASEPPPLAPLANPGRDYEVEMVAEAPADGSYVLRLHGRFFSQERRGPGERSFFVSNGTVGIYYSETDASGPRSLEITRAGSSSLHGIASRWERVAGRAPERVLGQTCTWQDDRAIRSTDLNYQCRTADGIALKTETGGHWGPVQRFTARRLSRAPLTDADFAVPARALDWAHWGVTPAP